MDYFVFSSEQIVSISRAQEENVSFSWDKPRFFVFRFQIGRACFNIILFSYAILFDHEFVVS